MEIAGTPAPATVRRRLAVTLIDSRARGKLKSDNAVHESAGVDRILLRGAEHRPGTRYHHAV
jgi:hypothetical protein